MFHPNSTPDASATSCDFTCEYIRSGNLLGSLVSIVVGLLLFFYVIYKVANLFTKLKQSKDRAKKLKENLDYILSLQGSNVQGEGVKDQYLGILFKKSPAYKKQTKNSIENINKLKDLKQKIEDMKVQEEEFKKDNEQLREIN